jgi:N-acetylglucosamine malate deacetylase 2
MADWKTELTGRVLVLVAHADDECVGYGALLQKMREPVLVIATDGAPRDDYFLQRYGSREAYAGVRRDEARRAAQVLGVYPTPSTGAQGAPLRELVLLAEQESRLEDQRLFLHLAPAYELLRKLSERVQPEAIATMAYEGGHPDHDSCSLLGARLGARLGVPVWEAALYNRAGADGSSRVQQFIDENGSEVLIEITPQELQRKLAMCAEYRSQGEILRVFDARREVVRPQMRYDYGRRPHPGPTNYELWQWWMKADEVSAKFAEFTESGR